MERAKTLRHLRPISTVRPMFRALSNRPDQRSGRSQVRRYHAQQDSVTERDPVLSRDLGQAIARQELHLVYQPIFVLDTGQVVKAEALLRWTHRELGRISPAEFIPIAERSGLIMDLGRWVLVEACRTKPTLA